MINAIRLALPSSNQRQKRTEAKKWEADLARRALVRRLQTTISQIDGVNCRIDQQRRDSLDAARKALAEGDRSAAERHVRFAQGRMVMSSRIEKQRWVFENTALQAEIGMAEQAMVDMMKEAALITQLSPAGVESAIQDVRAFVEQSNDFGEALETLGDEERLAIRGNSTTIPSVEAIMRSITGEVAHHIRTDGEPGASGTIPAETIAQRIGEGRAKIAQLMEDLK